VKQLVRNARVRREIVKKYFHTRFAQTNQHHLGQRCNLNLCQKKIGRSRAGEITPESA
jgi:hypothetical protein